MSTWYQVDSHGCHVDRHIQRALNPTVAVDSALEDCRENESGFGPQKLSTLAAHALRQVKMGAAAPELAGEALAASIVFKMCTCRSGTLMLSSISLMTGFK